MALIHKILIGAFVSILAVGVFMAAIWPAIAARPAMMHKKESYPILRASAESLLYYEQQKKQVAPSLDEAVKYALSENKIDQNAANQIISHYSYLTYIGRSFYDESHPPSVILHLESPDQADFDMYSDFEIKQTAR